MWITIIWSAHFFITSWIDAFYIGLGNVIHYGTWWYSWRINLHLSAYLYFSFSLIHPISGTNVYYRDLLSCFLFSFLSFISPSFPIVHLTNSGTYIYGKLTMTIYFFEIPSIRKIYYIRILVETIISNWRFKSDIYIYIFYAKDTLLKNVS